MVVPRQMPVGLRNFTGRSEHLQQLHQLVAAGARLGLITGPGGVGKTSLAIQWAHEVAGSFPDGVLYADLLGYAPATGPAEPHLVLPRFLTALGVRADNLPSTTDEQIALFRTLLADRSVLVVLDNARSTHQVRPLVASGPACFTLVTSRNELTGLIAADEAEVVPLDVLDPEQARQLLTARIGVRRLEGDPASGEELVARCAGLPIALSLLGAQIALRPRWPLDSFVQAMSTAPLDALTTPDGTGVRAVFSWSYQQLSPPAARLFGLLAHHPGHDLTLGAAAALAGAPRPETRDLLAELVAAHQLAEIAPGRYVLHDLLRSYGLELSDPADAEQAFLRLLSYLVHTGSAAAVLLSPTRDPIELPALDPAVDLCPPTTHAEALTWFESEQANSLAVLRAAAGRADRLLWLYVWALGDYLEYQGHPANLEIQRLALDAAIRLDNRQWQASTRRDLGRVHMALSQWDEAIRQQELALGLVEELGDERGIAHGSLSIARVYTRTGRQQLAIDHTLRALSIYQRIGHERGTAHSLNNLGWYHALLGEYDHAMDYAQRALHSYEGISSINGPPAALDTIAYIQAELGHLDEAIATWERVTDLYRELGSRPDLALTLTSLGRTYQRAGHTDQARTIWTEALHLYESLNHPQAAELRTHLKAMDDQQP
jgi:tetratricopeptide (TPR) repeat protein